MSYDPPDWVPDAVFYQIFPDRFASSQRVPKPGPMEPWDVAPTPHGFKGGDLRGIVEHLDHLVDLGISALYLNPVFASASNHRYHTYDYFTVDPLLGGNDALRDLVDALHARGMRVILDGVFNHTGRGFWPFHHVLESGRASPYRYWFHFDQEALDAGRPILAYPEASGRSGVAVDQPVPGEVPGGPGDVSLRQLGYRAWWDLPALPKLNTDEPAVRDYLLSVAEHWLAFGIDGWRLDVPEEIADEAFWQEFRRRCRAISPDAYLVGEIWHIAPEWLRGDRFDALMNYPLAETILGFTAADTLDEMALRAHHEYSANVRPIDGPAFAARLMEIRDGFGPDVLPYQLNLLDSHDTPRFRTLAGGDPSAFVLAAFIQATLPGAPCIYYGDEVGLEGRGDPDSRRSFPWDRAAWDSATFDAVRSVLRLRREEAALRRGRLDVIGAAGGAVVWERRTDDERLIAAVNAGRTRTIVIARADAARAGLAEVVRVGSADPVGFPDGDGSTDDGLVFELPPRSGFVFRVS